MNRLTVLHKWIIVIVVAALFNVAVYFFALAPALDKTAEVNAKLDNTNQQRLQLERRLAVLNAIDVDLLEAIQEELRVQIPPTGLLREFLIELDIMAYYYGLELVSVQAGAPTVVDEYMTIGLTVVVDGSYPGLFNYVFHLEEHERLLILESIVFATTEDVISGTIKIQIFSDDLYPHTPFDADGRRDPFR